MANPLLSTAQSLRDIWSLGEGPQVEDALYKYACNPITSNSVFNLDSWEDALRSFHLVSIDDQFIPPLVRIDSNNIPCGIVKDNDTLLYYDFRTDRAKPLTASFLNIKYGGQTGTVSSEIKKPSVDLVTMTHYDDNFTASPYLKEAFNPAEPLSDTYSEFAGKEGVKQLVVAESEKWRAVTWFKDGRRNLGYTNVYLSENGSQRIDKHPTLPITVKIVKSRQVAAHIQAPIMRARELTDILIDAVHEGIEDIFVNYANSDMVGHAMTDPNWFNNVVEAILELDTQLGRLIPIALEANYTIFITADHGNAESMIDSKGKANPAHTANKVPFILMGLKEEEKVTLRSDTTIGDLAPSVLHLRGISKPSHWDRNSAIVGSIIPDKHRKILKIVLDGYGISSEEKGNAMKAASLQRGSLNMDLWMSHEDNALSVQAEASGELCGYPKGEAGTTEFGHVIFDAGCSVRSDVLLIDHALANGSFNINKAFLFAIEKTKKKDSRLHIMGILSDGMVHSSLSHLDGILKLLSTNHVPGDKVSIHVITDGRDVPGDSSPIYIQWLSDKIKEYGIGRIDSIWGRGWGKDRDNRWKRIESAFRSLVEGTAAIHVKLK